MVFKAQFVLRYDLFSFTPSNTLAWALNECVECDEVMFFLLVSGNVTYILRTQKRNLDSTSRILNLKI